MPDFATIDDILGAATQRLTLARADSVTSVAARWFSLLTVDGTPGAGAITSGVTTSGVVPVAGDAGYPALTAFGGSAIGRLARVAFGSTVACRLALFDVLWVAGNYVFNSNASIAAPPSYASRIPDGDYKGTQIWAVCTSNSNVGNLAVNVTYTDQDGNAGAVTGATGIGAVPINRQAWQLPLAPGDSGVQKIEQVTASVATSGNFNVMVLRPLWRGRVRRINDGDTHHLGQTGLPRLFDTSALLLMMAADSTLSGQPRLAMSIANR